MIVQQWFNWFMLITFGFQGTCTTSRHPGNSASFGRLQNVLAFLGFASLESLGEFWWKGASPYFEIRNTWYSCKILFKIKWFTHAFAAFVDVVHWLLWTCSNPFAFPPLWSKALSVARRILVLMLCVDSPSLKCWESFMLFFLWLQRGWFLLTLQGSSLLAARTTSFPACGCCCCWGRGLGSVVISKGHGHWILRKAELSKDFERSPSPTSSALSFEKPH